MSTYFFTEADGPPCSGVTRPELPVAVGRGPDGGCRGGEVSALLPVELLLVPEEAIHPLLEAIDVVVNAALQQ